MTPDLPSGLTARPLVLDDLDDTFAVYAADELADAGILAIEREDVEGDWARPSFDLARDSIGVLEGRRLLGVAEVTRSGGHAEGAVLPGARGRGIGSWLAAWTEARAAELGAGSVGQNVPAGSTADRFLADRGYGTSHTAWVLQLPAGRQVPERELPAGYSLTTLEGPDQERAAHRVVQDAFGEWEGRTPETFEDWAATTARRPGTQPWQLRAVEHEGSVVGVAFTILDTTGCGYVHQLAVDRAHRGQGLAQALLADGFGNARAHGASLFELSTDTRTGALDLYLKVGMEVTQTWVHRSRALARD
ncbi:GNAT family N-acetyltransferase [Oryzobacter telluris]|uniref:GNAT family N-acetyltransferase n=1 Tax=Oryzobacter telluris TaxID=3149179 RepID=UPI00370D6E7C